jgi:hypothetical protein
VENGEAENKPQEENPNRTYQVKLRPPVFGYFAERIGEAYRYELAEIQKDGSFQGLKDFHESRFANLMTRILDQFTEPDKLPSKVTIGLSDEDIKVIKDRIKPPQDAAGARLHREMLRELGDNYASAKFGARTQKFLSRVKSFIRR